MQGLDVVSRLLVNQLDVDGETNSHQELDMASAADSKTHNTHRYLS
jgi:hypothetical protein